METSPTRQDIELAYLEARWTLEDLLASRNPRAYFYETIVAVLKEKINELA